MRHILLRHPAYASHSGITPLVGRFERTRLYSSLASYVIQPQRRFSPVVQGLTSPLKYVPVSQHNCPRHLQSSMVEPLSVLGGVAAGIQLFKYGIRLLGHLYDIPGDLRSAPDTIHDLLEEVDIFVNRVQSLEIESGASTDAAQLQALVIKYRRLAESMQDNLQSLKANPSDRRYKRWTKSAKFLKESKRISKLHEDITRCQATLHFFLTS